MMKQKMKVGTIVSTVSNTVVTDNTTTHSSLSMIVFINATPFWDFFAFQLYVCTEHALREGDDVTTVEIIPMLWNPVPSRT